jgi:coproporphyrinogen III oxidase
MKLEIFLSSNSNVTIFKSNSPKSSQNNSVVVLVFTENILRDHSMLWESIKYRKNSTDWSRTNRDYQLITQKYIEVYHLKYVDLSS